MMGRIWSFDGPQINKSFPVLQDFNARHKPTGKVWRCKQLPNGWFKRYVDLEGWEDITPVKFAQDYEAE